MNSKSSGSSKFSVWIQHYRKWEVKEKAILYGFRLEDKLLMYLRFDLQELNPFDCPHLQKHFDDVENVHEAAARVPNAVSWCVAVAPVAAGRVKIAF